MDWSMSAEPPTPSESYLPQSATSHSSDLRNLRPIHSMQKVHQPTQNRHLLNHQRDAGTGSYRMDPSLVDDISILPAARPQQYSGQPERRSSDDMSEDQQPLQYAYAAHQVVEGGALHGQQLHTRQHFPHFQSVDYGPLLPAQQTSSCGMLAQFAASGAPQHPHMQSHASVQAMSAAAGEGWILPPLQILNPGLLHHRHSDAGLPGTPSQCSAIGTDSEDDGSTCSPTMKPAEASTCPKGVSSESCPGPDLPRSGRAASVPARIGISSEDWEQHKATLHGLYMTRPLKEVMAYMKIAYGFHATTRMYKRRLVEKWGWYKYNSRRRNRMIMGRDGNQASRRLSRASRSLSPSVIQAQTLQFSSTTPVPTQTMSEQGFSHQEVPCMQANTASHHQDIQSKASHQHDQSAAPVASHTYQHAQQHSQQQVAALSTTSLPSIHNYAEAWTVNETNSVEGGKWTFGHSTHQRWGPSAGC